MLIHATQFNFGTKAETLHELRRSLTLSTIPEFHYFSVSEWLAQPTSVLQAISTMMKGHSCKVIVRSSAASEDSELFAQAGLFLSVPHIEHTDEDALTCAINDVIASYGDDSADNNHVLVQQMVSDVSMSGVLFSQDLSTGAPYYVINYDDESGQTDTVTSGTGYSNRTLYVYRDHWQQMGSERFRRLLAAVREVEAATESSCLDIEFALSTDLQVFLLQARRITTQPNWNRGLGLKVADALVRLQEELGSRLLGSNIPTEHATVFGKMPDWNPAEIIGSAPRKLAFSLYRYLITDTSWRKARGAMGYFEPRGMPLMYSCAGQPFIDVRQSFCSFVPASLPEPIRSQLVDHWLERLYEHPHLHDKVEFEVAVTAYAFDFDARAARLLPELADADQQRVEQAYKDLTIALVTGQRASISAQSQAIETLSRHYNTCFEQGDARPSLPLIARLLEDTIEYGTIPFAVLARHAFIARTLLDSLVAQEVLGRADVERFYQSVPTVASDFLDDIERAAQQQLPVTQLLEKYGHLRPGTYDILSLRYDQRGTTFLQSGSATTGHQSAAGGFQLTDKQKNAINRLLDEQGFGINAEQLLRYCADAIKGREWAKFVFTRTVSSCLEVLAAWGLRQGLSRDELSYLDIRDILDCRVVAQGRTLEHHLRTLAQQGEQEYQVTTAIQLPYLLTRPSDFTVIPMLLEQPNFITMKSVRAPLLEVNGRDMAPEELDGKVVVIESADPGFDWIFTRAISGLVTKFGGANSHMAIRCAEFNIPAAIGCGEQIFERVRSSKYIELDCAASRIEPLQH